MEHADKVGRVMALIRYGDQLLAADLRSDDVLATVEQATNETDIKKVSVDYGGNY